jgi:hypothetical protein
MTTTLRVRFIHSRNALLSTVSQELLCLTLPKRGCMNRLFSCDDLSKGGTSQSIPLYHMRYY